jgi:hypothetical protein
LLRSFWPWLRQLFCSAKLGHQLADATLDALPDLDRVRGKLAIFGLERIDLDGERLVAQVLHVVDATTLGQRLLDGNIAAGSCTDDMGTSA